MGRCLVAADEAQYSTFISNRVVCDDKDPYYTFRQLCLDYAA
jgi:hypothetical protein